MASTAAPPSEGNAGVRDLTSRKEPGILSALVQATDDFAEG